MNPLEEIRCLDAERLRELELQLEEEQLAPATGLVRGCLGALLLWALAAAVVIYGCA